jgi:dolichol kinase
MSVGLRGTRDVSRARDAARAHVATSAAGHSQPQLSSALAQPASIVDGLSSRMTAHEWRRRLVHMAPGVVPFILHPIPHSDPLQWYYVLLCLTLTVIFVTFALVYERLFLRRGERSWTTSVVSYGIIIAGMVLIFPSQMELVMAVTVIIAFGDGSATLAGLLARGRSLPWNRSKSWSGFVAFLLCAIPLSTVAYWGEARPGVPLAVALACVTPAVLVAALAESLPVRMNDNIRVGVAAGLTIALTHGMFVGW